MHVYYLCMVSLLDNFPQAVRIKKIIRETPLVKSYIFEYPVRAKPGQFVNIWVPGVDEKPMSIAYDNGKEFWVTIFAVGNFSKAVHTLKEGDLVGGGMNSDEVAVCPCIFVTELVTC